MESFMESLNRLRDIHEREVLSLQNKLLELNSERCREARRVEELCAKNQQLREQQKALKENVRVLENRLRAGLCDRCSVTQELARKKQQEFESSLVQSLQHVFVLTNEMTRLQEENETLKQEVTRLRGPGDRPQPQGREDALDTPPPLLLPSPGARKAVTEKLLGGQEGAEDDHSGAGPRGEEALGYRTSPVAKTSPGANLPEPRAPDMSPQRIANQLHGTIAVVRPGARACPADRGCTNGTPPLPPARSSPPSPPCERSLPLDSFLRATRPSAVTDESPKGSLQADRLCLLNRHLSLHLRSPHSSSSPRAPTMDPQGPRTQGPKAGEAEAWDDPGGLPGNLADMRDPRLEGALQLLLAQQLRAWGRAGSARPRGPPRQGLVPPSPPGGSDSEGPERETAGVALPGGRLPQPTGPAGPSGKAVTATQDHGPDKPLDLSEWGRGRDAPKPSGRLRSVSPKAARTPSPEPPAQPGPLGCSHGTKGARAPELEEPRTLVDPARPLPGPHPSQPSPGRMKAESGERPELSPHPQRPDADGHAVSSPVELVPLALAWWAAEACAPTGAPGCPPGLTHTLHPAELSKPERPWPVSAELDEPDSSDSEVGLSPKAGVTQSTPGEGPRCFCTAERGLSPQQKRKRVSSPDPWDKGTRPGRDGGCRSPGRPPTFLATGECHPQTTRNPGTSPGSCPKAGPSGGGAQGQAWVGAGPGPLTASPASPFNLVDGVSGTLTRGAEGVAPGWGLLGVVSVGPAPPSRAAGAAPDLRVSGHPHFLLWPQRQLQPGLQVPEKPLHT
ncbi:RBBP8 N-terminal-like protein [Pteropus medius]|uniref:RBBP8 N-terminal-like protein n=1 Tax=Pteropus vampyrus TaxID=132908 RepID=UPI00196B6A18|nr:RBBP8 N-terminal-like protein [Pteropus giganteus]